MYPKLQREARIRKESKSLQADTQMIRILRTFLVVVAVFFVCCLPSTILYVFTYVNKVPDTRPVYNFQVVANFLINFNSCLNPIIYSKIHVRIYKSAQRTYRCFRSNCSRSVNRKQIHLHLDQPYTPKVLSVGVKNVSSKKNNQNASRLRSIGMHQIYNLNDGSDNIDSCSEYQVVKVAKDFDKKNFSELHFSDNLVDEREINETTV